MHRKTCLIPVFMDKDSEIGAQVRILIHVYPKKQMPQSHGLFFFNTFQTRTYAMHIKVAAEA